MTSKSFVQLSFMFNSAQAESIMRDIQQMSSMTSVGDVNIVLLFVVKS